MIQPVNSDGVSHPFPQKTGKWMGHGSSASGPDQEYLNRFTHLEDRMRRMRFFVYAILLPVCALGAWAQSTASLSGTVTDPSGAVVPNAQVTVHSLGTGADRVVKTDSDGIYAVPSLQPGDYKVQATASGFSTYTVPKITLDVDRAVTVNMNLAVSTAGE